MDTEPVPAVSRQSEATSPIHEGHSGTSQTDPFNSAHPRTNARINSTNLRLSAPLSSTSSGKLEVDESSFHQPSRHQKDHVTQPIQSPARLTGPRDTKTDNDQEFSNEHHEIDWIVPVETKGGSRTVGERLQPTLDHAIIERDKYSSKAKWTGYTLNAAIGAQVLLGSLTTGLSALAVSGGQSAAKATTALGALATLVASYLARARGSNEPELSITRTKDLEQFIRECRTFIMDHGHMVGNKYDKELIEFRDKFEELLGNANGERKLSSV